MRRYPQTVGLFLWLGLVCLLAPARLPGAEVPAPNQDLLIRLWGVDDGMPSASVTSVAQTSEGYLWVGTLLSGVLRFDGVRFVSFGVANAPELSSLLGVRRLLVDQADRLWISTYANTLIIWDHAGFRPMALEKVRPEALLWSSENQVIFLDEGRKGLLCGTLLQGEWRWQEVALPSGPADAAVCADAEGRVWRLRSGNEIWCWQNGHTNTLQPPPGLEGQRVRVLVADSQGRVWAGTDQTVARWEGDYFVDANPSAGERLPVRRLVPAGNSLWVESPGRLRRLANEQWVAECEDWSAQAAQWGRLKFLQGDRKGGLWGGLRDQGLVHVTAEGKLVHLTTRDGLPSNSIQFAFQDREGNTWTGYPRGSLVRIRPRLFHTVGREQGLTETLVNSVCVDRNGALWAGTHGGEVFRVQNGEAVSMMPSREADDAASVVTADPAGGVWIGNFAGEVLHYGGHSGRVEKVAQLPRAVRLLLAGQDGRLWLGTIDGIWALSGKQLTHYNTPPLVDAHPTYISALGQSADGTLWAGTFQGVLFRLEGTNFARLDPPDYPRLGRLWSLCPASDGGLWIGTSGGGLLRYQEGRFRRYTTAEGLPTDRIAQVLSDAFGNLWLGTDVGLVRVAETVLRRFAQGEIPTLRVSLYSKADGLSSSASSIEFQPNCWRAADGSLWFAMANGVAQLEPARLSPNPIPPGVVLEEVRANGQLVWPARRGGVCASQGVADDLAHPPPEPALRLGPGRQDLELEFTALSFASPQGVRFRYQLQGADRDWTPPQTERHVSYRALPPGDYHFKVQACNSDGVWNEEGVQLAVVVVPYFWQTTWFAVALVLSVALLVALAAVLPLRARHQRRLRALKEQHALAQERARVAHDLHDELGAGLAQIGIMGALALRPSASPQRVHEHLEKITGKARELVRSLDEIVWAVNPKHDGADSLSSYLCDYAQEFLRPAAIACRLEVQAANYRLNSHQRHQLFLAFKEALTNVVRHAQATEVWIRISVRERELWLVVEDNGRGLPSGAAKPGSDGLSNMAERLEGLGGSCEAKSRSEGGTSVRFRLPLEPNPPD